MDPLNFVKQFKCVIFTKNDCSYCKKVIKDLKSIDAEFKLYDTETIDSQKLYNLTRSKTYPQIFIGNNFIGGYSELSILIMTNRIYRMLDMDPTF